MAKKAKCFIQVSGTMKSLHGKVIPMMKDWIAFVPNPVELSAVSIEALKFCNKEGIIGGEVIHYQKIGVVGNDD